jgi:hypothetical protein
MNRIIFFQTVLNAACFFSLSLPCHAQGHFPNTIVEGGARCDHVIQMILRHGVNNSFDRSNTSALLGQSNTVSYSLGIPLPINELGDLQIVQVEQLPTEPTPSGPKFAVIVMNKSNRQVCNFHVTAVAVFGQIHPRSPNATVEVAKINPGEALQVIVALSNDAYSMGNRNGQALCFEKLIVAVDSYDQLLETDEANNIKAFNSNEISVVVPVANPAISSIMESSGNPTTDPQQLESQGPFQPSGMVQNQSQNQGSYVSVDALDLEQPTPESLRSAIKQVTTVAPAQAQVPVQPQGQVQTQAPGMVPDQPRG